MGMAKKMRPGNGPYTRSMSSKKGYVQFAISLPPELHDRMVREGERRGLNRMNYLRLLIAEALEKK